MATGELVVNEEIQVVRADGTAAVIMQTSAPVIDAANEIVGAVVVTLDVTERKEAEQLRDAFLGVLSHELRTPVTTIYGAAQYLVARGERLEPDVRRSSREISPPSRSALIVWWMTCWFSPALNAAWT